MDTQRRLAGALLIAGPAVFLLAEFITAAAWTDPPYSYTHHFISNLGVQGPSTLFGQLMISPLYWLMNAAFMLFGVIIFAGVASLRGLTGWRRWAVLVPAAFLAVGGILLGLFPGSAEALENGTGEFHSTGAFAGFLGAAVVAILLGHMRGRLGFSVALRRGLVAVGVIGLLSTVLYFVLLVTSVDGGGMSPIIGLIERGATHPILIGLLVAGASIVRRRPQAALA